MSHCWTAEGGRVHIVGYTSPVQNQNQVYCHVIAQLRYPSTMICFDNWIRGNTQSRWHKLSAKDSSSHEVMRHIIYKIYKHKNCVIMHLHISENEDVYVREQGIQQSMIMSGSASQPENISGEHLQPQTETPSRQEWAEEEVLPALLLIFMKLIKLLLCINYITWY